MIKTFHIHGHSQDSWLLKRLYNLFLKDDPSWHFVFWNNGWTHKAFIGGSNIILRVSLEEIQNKVREFLLITPEVGTFEEYDFPFCRGKYQLGISRLSWESRNMDIMLPMLHSISLAAVKFGNGRKYRRFIQTYWHMCMNLGGFDHAQEISEMACQIYGSSKIVEDWYHNMGKDLQDAKIFIDFLLSKAKKAGIKLI